MANNLKYSTYRFKYNFGRFLGLSVPVDLMLELSSLCNMRCGYCYHSDPKNLQFKTGFMNTDLALYLLSQGSSIGISSVKFNYRGEGTLHPDYKKISVAAKNHGTYIDRIVNSNFKFKNDREDIFEALCNMTKVKVSFDSFDKDVFESQRVGGKHSQALKNIDKFYSYKGRDNELVIQAVRTNLNKDEDIAGIAKKRWPEAKISIRDAVGGRHKDAVEESFERKRDFRNRIPCKQAFVRLVVHHDGLVAACCPDVGGKIILGDSKNESLKSIFNNDKAKQLRKSLVNKTAFNEDPCSGCSSFESFKGYKSGWNS